MNTVHKSDVDIPVSEECRSRLIKFKRALRLKYGEGVTYNQLLEELMNSYSEHDEYMRWSIQQTALSTVQMSLKDHSERKNQNA